VFVKERQDVFGAFADIAHGAQGFLAKDIFPLASILAFS